jgi:hypothetical protein
LPTDKVTVKEELFRFSPRGLKINLIVTNHLPIQLTGMGAYVAMPAGSHRFFAPLKNH